MSAVARSSLADVSKRPFGRRASGRTGSSFLFMGLAVDGLALASRLLAHRGAPSKRRSTGPDQPQVFFLLGAALHRKSSLEISRQCKGQRLPVEGPGGTAPNDL